jgi:toxin-antitoxin system PIN domain toxin
VRLPDVNVLLYALDASSPRHDRARPWLEGVLSGSETVAFAWSVLLGVVRLCTRSAVFERPLSVDEALDVVAGWLERPNATVVHPTIRHGAILRELLAPFGSAGNLVTDAHLAALAVEHGATVCSSDADFSRFEGLRWEDPLRIRT